MSHLTLIQTPVQTREGIVALLDLDEPAKIAPAARALVPIATPDFIENGFAWWIGEHGAVGCEADMPEKGDKAERGTFLARRGEYPAMHGFVVNPFDPNYKSQTHLSKFQDAYDLWRIVQDTLLVDVEVG